MKVAVIDTTVHGNMIGGGHLIAVELLRGLIARGHDVHFVSADTPNLAIKDKIASTGVSMHQAIWNNSAPVDDSTPHAARWFNELAADVHLISASGDIGWTVLPLLNPRIATLTIGHNDQETFYAPVKHYHRFLTRAIGVSEEICRKYVAECGMPVERVDWIPYGVATRDDEPVTSESGPVKLVYVGRFENTQKRISDVIKIIKKLDETGIDFTFDMVGDGEEMPAVRSELSAQIDSGRVRVHGWVDSPEAIEIMRSSEVFVLASAYEGFCISLTEAMANGCTPIVSDIRSGNKQLVTDGVSGFVVPVGDVDGFVDRIRVLAGDRGRLREMRVAAWRTGREYGVDRMVDNYVSCFERAIEDTRSNPRTPDPTFPLMESCRSKYPLWLRRIKARVSGF
jgi:glycosyltransferase involved in cell wall biosynthesis